jgi:hypothetical protein
MQATLKKHERQLQETWREWLDDNDRVAAGGQNRQPGRADGRVLR